jgi:hypothetical protein
MSTKSTEAEIISETWYNAGAKRYDQRPEAEIATVYADAAALVINC